MEKEIKIVVEKLRTCIKELHLECKLELESNVVTLKFEKEPEPELVKKIEVLVFFTNEMIVSNINEIFSNSGKVIMIRLDNYSKFCQMYETLKSFKCYIFMAEINDSNLVFHYTLKHKHDLNYGELNILQNIVNPCVAHHDSIRVSYCNGVATLNANLAKTVAHFD